MILPVVYGVGVCATVCYTFGAGAYYKAMNKRIPDYFDWQESPAAFGISLTWPISIFAILGIALGNILSTKHKRKLEREEEYRRIAAKPISEFLDD